MLLGKQRYYGWMRSVLVGVMCAATVVAAAGCSENGAPHTDAPIVEDASAYEALIRVVNETVTDIGTTWKGLGAPAVSMQMQSFRNGETSPECGGLAVTTTSVCFYTTPPLLNWNRDDMVSLKESGGPLAPAITLAREYGRILLAAKNAAYSGHVPALQAECLAGVYVRERGAQYVDDVSDALENAYEVTASDAIDPEFKLQRKVAFYTFVRTDVGTDPLQECMDTRF